MKQEEKAKVYDKALERAKQIIMDYDYDEHNNIFMEIFPELKESNEKIKSCICMILTDANETRFNDFHTTLAACLNCLEKQGRQKPACSEEDQNALEDVREAIVHYWGGETQDILLYWLKSLKQRIKGE